MVQYRIFSPEGLQGHLPPVFLCVGSSWGVGLALIGSVLFFSRPRPEGWPHHDALSPFIPVLCHSD